MLKEVVKQPGWFTSSDKLELKQLVLKTKCGNHITFEVAQPQELIGVVELVNAKVRLSNPRIDGGLYGRVVKDHHDIIIDYTIIYDIQCITPWMLMCSVWLRGRYNKETDFVNRAPSKKFLNLIKNAKVVGHTIVKSEQNENT